MCDNKAAKLKGEAMEEIWRLANQISDYDEIIRQSFDGPEKTVWSISRSIAWGRLHEALLGLQELPRPTESASA